MEGPLPTDHRCHPSWQNRNHSIRNFLPKINPFNYDKNSNVTLDSISVVFSISICDLLYFYAFLQHLSISGKTRIESILWYIYNIKLGYICGAPRDLPRRMLVRAFYNITSLPLFYRRDFYLFLQIYSLVCIYAPCLVAQLRKVVFLEMG